MTILPETSPVSLLVCTAGSSASGTRWAMSTCSSPLSISAVSCESCWASLRTKTPTARTSRAWSLGVGIVGIVFTTTPAGLDPGDQRLELRGGDGREVEQHVDRLGHGVRDRGGGVVDDLVGARGGDALAAAGAGGG